MTHTWVHRLISNPADENQQSQREWVTKLFSVLGDALKIASYLHYWVQWSINYFPSSVSSLEEKPRRRSSSRKITSHLQQRKSQHQLLPSLSYTFSLPSCSDNIFLLPHHHDIRREYRKPSVCQIAHRQLAWEVLNCSQVRAERKPGMQQMVWILADAEDEESDVVKRDGPPKQKTEKGKKEQRKKETWMGNVQIILLLHLTSSSQPEQHAWAPHSFPHMSSRKQKAQHLSCTFPFFKGNRENEIVQNSSDITGHPHLTIRQHKRERLCTWWHTHETSSAGMPKKSTLPSRRHQSAAPSEFSNHTKHFKARWKPLNVN